MVAIIIIIVIIVFVFSKGSGTTKSKKYDLNYDIYGVELDDFSKEIKRLAMYCKYPDAKKSFLNCIYDNGTVNDDAAVRTLANYVIILLDKELHDKGAVHFGVTSEMIRKKQVTAANIAQYGAGEGFGIGLIVLEMELKQIVFCDIYGNELSGKEKAAKAYAKYGNGALTHELQDCIREDGTLEPVYNRYMDALVR